MPVILENHNLKTPQTISACPILWTISNWCLIRFPLAYMRCTDWWCSNSNEISEKDFWYWNSNNIVNIAQSWCILGCLWGASCSLQQLSFFTEKACSQNSLDTVDRCNSIMCTASEMEWSVCHLLSVLFLTHLNNTLCPLSHETAWAYYTEAVAYLIVTEFPGIVSSIHYTHTHTHTHTSIHFPNRMSYTNTHTIPTYIHTYILYTQIHKLYLSVWGQ